MYSHTDELNGWSQNELLCVLGVQILMGGVIRTYIQPNMTRLIEEVREGTLDYALTKPEDAQMLVSVREVRIWQVRRLCSRDSSCSASAYPGSRLISGLVDALAFGVALLVGAVLIYCFWLVIATGAFWIVNMWHAIELFDGVYLTGRWPVGIYPGWLRYSVTFLVPIAFAVTVPAEAVDVAARLEDAALAIVFAIALFALHSLVLAVRASPLLGRVRVSHGVAVECRGLCEATRPRAVLPSGAFSISRRDFHGETEDEGKGRRW